MENVFFYFLKVNGLLIVFYFAYLLFLRKETFFQSNRWYLLLGIVSAFILPLITFTTIVWVTPEPFDPNTTYYDGSNYSFPTTAVEEPFDWNQFLFLCYILISLFFLTKLAIEVVSFFKIIRKGKKIKVENMVLVETHESQNPFSFFNYLVYNQSQFTAEELHMILIHEKIHIQQNHSIDVLLSKLVCLLFWVNPIVWLYRKAILENLEFIADAETASATNNTYLYQKTLLKAVLNQQQLSITNQFYQSLIKKRIVMLNKNQSHRKKLWKYSLILPLLVGFVLLFQIETIAQVKETEEINTQDNIISSNTRIESKITKNSTDKDLEDLKLALQGTLGITMKFENIKRNKKNEIIRIKVIATTDKSYKSVIELDEKEGIQPFKVIAFENNNKEKSVNFSKENEQTASKTTVSSTSTITGKSAVIEYDGWKIITEEADKNPVLFVVNETKLATGTNIQFDYTVEVLHSKELNEKEAVKKYGKVGKNGAYEFTVAKPDYANQLYIINGKEYTSNELKGKKVHLEGDIIKLSNEDGIARYGKKGRNGVSIFNGTATITEDGKKDVISFRSTTYTEQRNLSQELPEPPAPPTPPTTSFERVGKVPTPPKFPQAPSVPADLQDEKEMKKFEEQMAVFEMKMKKIQPQIAQFEKEMEVYEKEMQSFEPDMKDFEKQMEEFERKMEVYQQEIIQKNKIINEERAERIKHIEALNKSESKKIQQENEAHRAKIEAERQKMRAEREKRKAEEQKRIAAAKKE